MHYGGNASRSRSQPADCSSRFSYCNEDLLAIHLLGIRLIARSGLNTLIVRMADRFIFSTFRQYSNALQASPERFPLQPPLLNSLDDILRFLSRRSLRSCTLAQLPEFAVARDNSRNRIGMTVLTQPGL